jgi:enamine deaminase RidA (YjgF/YER057c/UK114 family)
MTRRTHEQITQALADVGFALPEAPAPLAAYTPGLVVGEFAFTSGQLPLVDGALLTTGKVGFGLGAVRTDEAAPLAARCALNALAALAATLGDLGRIDRIVKVTGFVASEADFDGQSAVIDGASNLLALAFGEAGVHTRSAVGVAALPKNSPVAVELIVSLR